MKLLPETHIENAATYCLPRNRQRRPIAQSSNNIKYHPVWGAALRRSSFEVNENRKKIRSY